ncbi:hypothetical protein BDZ45DRAFT_745474 [Acephala macrosclerotiorum]|nr:hypothetical protein BDZ45DRAFT_745474 [Acephala macrosclerotiorum]
MITRDSWVWGKMAWSTPDFTALIEKSSAIEAGHLILYNTNSWQCYGQYYNGIWSSSMPNLLRILSYENTKAQVKQTLKETEVCYIDLMLIHTPYDSRSFTD